ncbi:undecaprenyl-phosphate glucose phosphotransferase [Zhengella mangrovi]|uniref:Undecaprenyl-phosphate glucose phosphotransferase n=1 Tax=Zhengella mangrovi TaxID=1982044 RepID=A0A2G1QN55_9HYPH|nr:undecaprenyl-phosphate glucose phosphotransferase [Zhengella mangrovi]PHP66880.1 undecaprenyl-phosphate glucose phosphotransferase [Zhengella mangrovi]
MNQIDPKKTYSPETVRSFQPEDSDRAEVKRALNAMAKTVAAQYRDDSLSPNLIGGIVRLFEFYVMFLTGFAVFANYLGSPFLQVPLYVAAIFVGSILTVVMFEFAEGYRISRLRRPFLRLDRTVLAYAGTFGLLALTSVFLKISADFSRVWFGTWAVTGFVGILVLRAVFARLIARWSRNGRMERRAVIVGGGKEAEKLIRSIERSPHNDVRICGIFDDRDDSRSPPIVAGYPKLGTVDDLLEFARIARIDMMIVALPLTAERRVLTMLKKLWVLPVDIRLSAHANMLQFRPRSYSYVGNVPMLDIFDKPITDWDSVAKRMFDIVFSALAIIAFSPVMLATAIAIKLESKGPVLFKQKRHGFNNEPIEVYKFRSMYTEMCDPTAKQAVTKDDPRVTRVGRFIRKTSIDELPQFFNALFGSLSLVGPRPHAVAAQAHNLLFTEVVDGYFARHRVKPGVTGWAQINGWRGEVDSDEKIQRRTEFDLYYIENWSLLFDLKILFLTPIRLLKTDNAY